MSTTNKQFQWVDRDTAARDLLPLYQYDLDFLRDRVLTLLRAIRSPAVIPDLLKIALDENTSDSAGSRIIDIISITPGDFYLVDFEFLNQKYELLKYGHGTDLLKNHPTNKTQVLPLLMQQIALNDDVKELCKQYKEWLDCFPHIITPLLTQLLDNNSRLFDLSMAAHIHHYAPEFASKWLHSKWDEIIYLCLIEGIRDRNLGSPNHHRLIRILDNWVELKEDLFRRCPAIIEEYAYKKLAFDYRSHPKFDIRSCYVWQELEMNFGLALQNGEDAIKNFLWGNRYGSSDEDAIHKAVAIYLGGTVLDRYPSLIRHYKFDLEFNNDSWREGEETYDVQIHYPIRYEAGNALRKIITASTWDTFIRAYLKQPFPDLNLWIADITDQLSGIAIEPAREPPLEYRPWFRELFESERAKPKTG